MVAAGDIVADRFRRIAAEEDGAGIAHRGGQPLGIVDRELEMLGRYAVDQRHRIGQFADGDDGAMARPALGGDGGALETGKLRIDRRCHRVGKAGIVGDEDGLRGGVMLGLREEIGGDPGRIVAAVGDHQYLGGAGDEIDADSAEDAALGRRDIGVAGTDDLVDRRNRPRAMGERRHRLRQHERIEHAVRRRHHHDHSLDPGDLGRNRVHQHRGRVGGGAARDVEPDRRDGAPARAQPHAGGVAVVEITGHLAPVVGFNALGGEAQGGQRLAVAAARCRRDLRRRDAQRLRRQRQAVEAFRIIDQRRVTARDHVGDDRGDRRIDIGRRLALGGDEPGKSGGKAGSGGVEPKRQAPSRGSVRASARPRRAASSAPPG